MFNNILIIYLLVLFTSHSVSTIGMSIEGTKFLYQQDVSEHCRRRVIPSVFLGQHVVEADAKMMHFSQLELPYNCLISVRAESGNHIILVIQLNSEGTEEACKNNGDQLLVFQVSETFGGYWAPIPASATKTPYPKKSTYYTLPASTESPTVEDMNESEERYSEEYEEAYDDIKESFKKDVIKEDKVEKRPSTPDMVVVEIPLLNVSARLVPGEEPLTFERDYDQSRVDVPGKEIMYDTEIVNLVKFSTMSDKSWHRRNEGEEPLFEVSYNKDFDLNRSLLPTTIWPNILWPTSLWPATSRLNTTKSTTTWPATTKSTSSRPTTTRPVTTRPSTTRSTSTLPTTTGPTTLRPTIAKFTGTQPTILPPTSTESTSTTSTTNLATIISYGTNINATTSKIITANVPIMYNGTRSQKSSSNNMNYTSNTATNQSKITDITTIATTKNITKESSLKTYSSSITINDTEGTAPNTLKFSDYSVPKVHTKIFLRQTLFPATRRVTNLKITSRPKTPFTLTEGKHHIYQDPNFNYMMQTNAYNKDYNNKMAEVSTSRIYSEPESLMGTSVHMEERKSLLNKMNSAHISRLKDFTSFTKSHHRMLSVTGVPFRRFLKKITTTAIIKYNSYDDVETSKFEDFTVNSIRSFANEKQLNRNEIVNILNNNIKVPPKVQYHSTNNENNTGKYRTENIKIKSTSSTPWNSYLKSEKDDLLTHESWDNVVKVAPKMAKLLNKTFVKAHDNNSLAEKENDLVFRNKIRGKTKNKRHIEPLSISHAKPHKVAKLITNTSYIEYMESQDILQNIGQLLELSDDEVSGRISQHYFHNFMAYRPVFNICEYEDRDKRHVVLLNTSRVVLVIANFTLEGMTIVTTSAKSLRKADGKCANDQLECQISGHRVCIESTCACDGIPNCGSYDIYDEDRLRCGTFKVYYSIYLAVVAFLAVVLTMIYTIYFWLQRCVPKVSEAFFIYIAGTDNSLYLDSIMKSPHDDFQRAEHPSYFYENITIKSKPEISTARKFLKTFLSFITFKKNKELPDDEESNIHKPARKIYSFTEYEINKMILGATYDKGVQTGPSLEMGTSFRIGVKSSNTSILSYDKQNQHMTLKKETSQHRDNAQELQALKLFNRVRPHSSTMLNKQLTRISNQSLNEEKELYNVDINETVTQNENENLKSNLGYVHNDQKDNMVLPKKKLRFEKLPESSTNIDENSNKSRFKSIPQKKLKRPESSLETIVEERIDDNAPKSRPQKGNRRFWKKDKNKKATNKQQSFLPLS